MHRNRYIYRLACVIALALLTLAVSPTAASATAIAAPTLRLDQGLAPAGMATTDLEAFLDTVIGEQMALDHIPGAIVSVVTGGQIVVAKGYGYADVEQRTPMRADTVFAPGSVAKLVTWTAVMQLVEQGKLDLHTDVNRYLQHVQIPATYPEPITLAHLLTHTAGFEEIPQLNAAFLVQDSSMLKPLETIITRVPARIHAPGQIAAYCNYCTALAGEIVAEVSGEPFEQYVARRIFQPLGMQRSTFAQPLPPDLAAASAAYYKVDAAGAPHRTQLLYMQHAPIGALNTTATDMAHFMIAHLQDGRYGDGRILQAASAQDMHRQHYAFDPRLPGITWGWFEDSYNGVRLITHAGNNEHSGALLALLPDQQTGIFMGFNRRTSEHARWAVLHAFLDHAYPAPAPPDVQPPADFAQRAERFAGAYRSTRRFDSTIQKLSDSFNPANTVVANADGTLSVTGPGAGLTERDGTAKRWVEIAPLLFREVGGQATLAFRAGAAGQITALAVSTFPFVSYERLAWYDQGLVQLGAAGLALFTLLTTGLAWLVGALVRRIRHAPDTRSPLERHVRRVAAALIVLNLLLVGSVLVWMSDGTLVTSIPPALYVTVALGLIEVLGAAALAIGAVQVWRRRAGGLFGRLHYTLLTLAALGMVAFLQSTRLLGLHV